MDPVSLQDLDKAVPLQGMLGYLNFSEGRPDARFQKQIDDAYRYLAGRGDDRPWQTLCDLLNRKLALLKANPAGPFKVTLQVEAVLKVVFQSVLPGYARHHADLLFHQTERDLFQPFFLARVFEAVLALGAPWDEEERILQGSLNQLNDFVGYRPLAILETRQQGEPYDHERVRPIPLYIRGTGAAWGRYHDLIAKAMDILKAADPNLLADAHLDPDLLDELAVDPRAYDHNHPANRRPNHVFGEWDPHHLDNQGRFRRYVARQITLEGLLGWVDESRQQDRGEILFEAAAVLAGTIIMATGISGASTTTHESVTSLATLMPGIAGFRDAFYSGLLNALQGAHGDRLRVEAQRAKQPFGGARQYLNQFLSRNRATQLQQRQLALLFAQMGYAEEGRREAARIPAASLRILSEMVGKLITGHLWTEQNRYAEAAGFLPEIEDLLKRGIACGALVDPWNILGFQGLFPLFTAQEDSVRDHRVDELLFVMRQLFDLFARLMSEAGAAGNQELLGKLERDFSRLASWWDRFATVEVQDVTRIHGGEALESAGHVARAMARWHERGEATGDIAFWRQHQESFRSPKAFALVIDALLDKKDYRAAMALLMTWLSQADDIPLEENNFSFHEIALRWMLSVTRPTPEGTPATPTSETWSLLHKFMDYLEANAEDYWRVPQLEVREEEQPEDEEGKDLFGAAYEGMTFKDSTDDDVDSSVAGDGPPQEEFDLDEESERLGKRLRFLATVARLWQIAARWNYGSGSRDLANSNQREVLQSWLTTALENQARMLAFLDALHAYPIADPTGSYDSLVEFDRRRIYKEQFLYATISTCLDTTMAVGTLRGMVAADESTSRFGEALGRPPWESLAIQLEQAIFHVNPDQTRALLPEFMKAFEEEPLVFMALAEGGNPRQILRARIAQGVLRALVVLLPRMGLIRETFLLVQKARSMEKEHPPQGRGVSEFNSLFQAGYQSCVAVIVDSAKTWNLDEPDKNLVKLLERVAEPFLKLWLEHSQTLMLFTLETIKEEEWLKLKSFIQTYGRDLFHARFMTMANLRGLLHGGVTGYIDHLRENEDPLHPVQLLHDLDQKVTRQEAERYLQLVLQVIIENYEEYKDYNTCTTQSDYGDNLHVLLEFLRVKAGYLRQSWQLQPLAWTHEVLARRGLGDAARLWLEPFSKFAGKFAEEHLDKLQALEQAHSVRLRTVADRIQERFLKPLDLDRICALVKPAVEEARKNGNKPSMARLQQELTHFTTNPTGVGLDVPDWLRRLELEVQQVRMASSTVVTLAEDFFRLPRAPLSLESLQQQLADWEKPLES